MKEEQLATAWEKTSDEEKICLLAWHDVIERLDTILLEIRHLQISLVYMLRRPELNMPLRYEESYLWGEGWFNRSSIDGGAVDDATLDEFLSESPVKYVGHWIVKYPSLAESNEQGDGWSIRDGEGGSFFYGDKAKFVEIEQELNGVVREGWFESAWGQDQRRKYHVLSILQRLKSRVLEDKVYICQSAFRWKLDRSGEGSHYYQSQFLILRSAVLHRTKDYILRLKDMQSQIVKAIDSGQQDHPKPSLERRRELGVYMDHLANRTRDIARDVRMLLTDVRAIGKTPSAQNSGALVMHRWSHDVMSRTSTFYDAVGRVDFVNTNFFMPERPDIQPEIAHEVAHSVIARELDDLSDQYFQSRYDDFSELVVQLTYAVDQAMRSFGVTPNTIGFTTKNLVTEMTADLLACSVKGHSFLYALFMEIVGLDQYRLLQSDDGTIDLELINSLDSVTHQVGLLRQWQIRLNVTSRWLQQIHHREHPAPLDLTLIRGTRKVANHLADHLNGLAVKSGIVSDDFWNRLTERLSEIVVDSGLSESVRVWRSMRSEDCDDKHEKSVNPNPGSSADREEDDFGTGPVYFPVTYSVLPTKWRRALLKIQLTMKRGDGRALQRYNEAIRDHHYFHSEEAETHSRSWLSAFCESYGVTEPGKPNGVPKELYRHLQDLPWQSALMRAHDMMLLRPKRGVGLSVNSRYVCRPDKFLSFMHHDFPLGREMFDASIEFFTWQTDLTIPRLRNATRLIKHALHYWATDGRDALSRCDAESETRLVLEKMVQWLTTGIESHHQQSYSLGLKSLDAFLAEECGLDKTMIANSTITDLAKAWCEYVELAELRLEEEFPDQLSLRGLGSFRLEESDRRAIKRCQQEWIDTFSSEQRSMFSRHDSDGWFESNRRGGKGSFGKRLNVFRTADVISKKISALKLARGVEHEPHAMRGLEIVAKRKIVALYEILRDWKGSLGRHDYVVHGQLLSLYRYVSARAPSNRDPFYNLVVPALGNVIDMNESRGVNGVFPDSVEPIDDKLGARIPSYVIGRLSYAGAYSKPSSPLPHSLSLQKALCLTDFEYGYPLTSEQSAAVTSRHVATLGRYDALLLSKNIAPLCRCHLPKFASKSSENTNDYLFPSFFTRRELARSANLSCVDPDLKDNYGSATKWSNMWLERSEKEAGETGTVVIGTIAILFERRAYRLDFLYRLLESIKCRDSSSVLTAGPTMSGQFSLEQVGSWFSPLDVAFMTDGWADVLLVFQIPNVGDILKEASQRRNDIESIATILLQDFMVDRTEVIWSTVMFDAAFKKSSPEKVNVRIQARMKEDRDLRPSLRLYERSVKNSDVVDEYGSTPVGSLPLPEMFRSASLDDKSVEVSRSFWSFGETAGRMDFSLRIGGWNEAKVQDVDSPYKACMRWVCSDDIDRIDTSVATRVSDLDPTTDG